MLRRMFVTTPAVLTMSALIIGCAGSRLPASDLPAAAVAPADDLSGTWYGTFGQVAASLYEDDGKSALRINPDGTFTATVTPGLGTNNLAKPATWSGTVVTNGDRVTLRNAEGPWPWITLTKSGDGMLYGLAIDPAIEATVMMNFERDGTGQVQLMNSK
jgi:hypothetical protein